MLIKINYLKPDEYWAAVDAAEHSTINYVADEITLLDAEAADSADASADTTADASGDTTADASADTAADTTTKTDKPVVKDVSQMTFNEAIDYVFDIDDITLPEPQIDVFVVDDYDKFLELADDERLAEIDIKYDRKVLTKYIHPTILSTTSIDGKTYGVPANFKMEGKYEFWSSTRIFSTSIIIPCMICARSRIWAITSPSSKPMNPATIRFPTCPKWPVPKSTTEFSFHSPN